MMVSGVKGAGIGWGCLNFESFMLWSLFILCWAGLELNLIYERNHLKRTSKYHPRIAKIYTFLITRGTLFENRGKARTVKVK